MANKNSEYFTRDEAEALVGKHIRTLVAWSGVPIHTTGRVKSAHKNSGWTVAIQWDLPIKPLQVGVGESAEESFLVISGGTPLVDWFSKTEYEKFLMEITEGREVSPTFKEPKNFA